MSDFLDPEHEASGKVFEKCPITDFSKLNLSEPGVIHYKLYAQDGSFVPMTVRDTYSNRLFVSWVQIRDRYTVSRKDPAP